ncbi:MAG: hypothetical protein R2799_08370 [Crocinitomicaceae bacterium]
MPNRKANIKLYDQPQQIKRSFYYWKSYDFEWQGEHQKFLNQLNVDKLYVKFFEVEPNASYKAIPIDKTTLNLNGKSKMEIVPTVYVQNQAFKYYTQENVAELAENIWFLVQKRLESNFNKTLIREIQIDCDWTKTTKEVYFELLRQIKMKSHLDVSATLRLYPYKYPEIMGVPPVDRVMLMCYNLTNPVKNKSINSVLDVEEFGKYVIEKSSYTIPMDYVFPIFEYKLLYRQGDFQGMIYSDDIQIDQVAEPVSKLWYEVQQDTVIDRIWFRKGDWIKWERVEEYEIRKVMDLVEDKMKFDSLTTISFFHLDERIMNKTYYENLDYLYKYMAPSPSY